jgi:hypothetical protein
MLALSARGCCMAYATAKAEIVAGLVPEDSAELFKNYCKPFQALLDGKIHGGAIRQHHFAPLE